MKSAQTERKLKEKAERQASAYRTMRDVWDRASRAQVELEREGKTITPESVWERMGAEGDIPSIFRTALAHDGYKQIVDLRRRIAVIPQLQNLGILRGLASQGAYLAVVGALEDLALDPDALSTKDKIAAAKVLTDIYKSISPAEEEVKGDNLTDAAVDEEKQMESALALIPEALRPKMRELYIKERTKHLGERRALHLVELNKPLSHANTG